MKLSEEYMARCLENYFTAKRSHNSILSYHRNVYVGYGEDPFSGKQNEADVIVYDGQTFEEIEIKVKMKDLLKDFHSLIHSAARNDKLNRFEFLIGYLSKSKQNKFMGMFKNSAINKFSFCIPSYLWEKLSNKQHRFLKELGIGVYLYTGNGKIGQLLEPKKINNRNLDTEESNRLLAFFNRPTLNAKSIRSKAKRSKRKKTSPRKRKHR